MRGYRRAPARRHHRPACRAPLVLRALALTGLAGLAGLISAYRMCAAPMTADRPPPLYLGLDSYLHLGQLSYLEVGDRVQAQTAAQPGGQDTIVHTRILLHQFGPGIVTSMRMRQALGSPWQLAADNRTVTFTPAVLGQSSGLFPYSLALNASQSQGSSIVNTPVPFRHAVELHASARNANFDGIYTKLPFGFLLPADSALSAANPAIAKAAAVLGAAGTDIAPPNLPSQSGTTSLGPSGSATTLATITGSDQIRSLSITVPLSEAVQLGNSTLQIFWDGQTTPAVSAPLKFLAGDGAGIYEPAGRQLVQGLLAGITSDGQNMSFNLYYPMPFASSARIAIVASDSSALLGSVGWSVAYQPFTPPADWWGNFRANYTSIPSPPPGQDMTFLDYSGSGKLVGTVVNFGAIGTVLQGGPQIFIDDSKTPQIPYTGSEEWGLGGNWFNNGTQDSLPLGGLPSSTNNPPGTDVEGAALYRFLIADAIAFNSHLTVDWEHGGVDQTTGPYSAAMMWYGTPRQTAVQTDNVSVGSRASSTAHHYDSPGPALFKLTAAYEYQPHLPLITRVLAANLRLVRRWPAGGCLRRRQVRGYLVRPGSLERNRLRRARALLARRGLPASGRAHRGQEIGDHHDPAFRLRVVLDRLQLQDVQLCHLTACKGPVVSLLARHGRVLPFRYRDRGDQLLISAKPHQVVLVPGRAFFGINKNVCVGRSTATARSLAAWPLGQLTVRLTRTLDYCGPHDPGHLVDVSPFEKTLRAVLAH